MKESDPYKEFISLERTEVNGFFVSTGSFKSCKLYARAEYLSETVYKNLLFIYHFQTAIYKKDYVGAIGRFTHSLTVDEAQARHNETVEAIKRGCSVKEIVFGLI